MTTKTSLLSSSLSDKHDHLKNALESLTTDTLQMHGSLTVRDEASRAAFASLSRITAFSEQIDLILELMREDVRVVEELSDASAEGLWNQPFGDSFQRWLRSAREEAPKLN